MKTRWTDQEWLATRINRRRIADSISPAECGRKDSRADADYRAAFGGRRNLKFATTEELAEISRRAAEGLDRGPR